MVTGCEMNIVYISVLNVKRFNQEKAPVVLRELSFEALLHSAQCRGGHLALGPNSDPLNVQNLHDVAMQ